MGTGDGGSGNDPGNRSQNGQCLLGKLLRFDVDATVTLDENPHFEEAGVLPEIWALGLRNPWRFSFDFANSDLYIADVGQNKWEEINYLPFAEGGGDNYESKVEEGDDPVLDGSYGPGTRVPPIYCYPHSSANLDLELDCDPGGSGAGFTGFSVTGGYVYRGCKIPALQGTYFFADYVSNRVWSFEVVGGVRTNRRDWTDVFNVDDISTAGVDGRGELYLCELKDGNVYRTAPVVTGPPPEFRRGDSTADGKGDLSDGLFVLRYRFLQGP